MNENVLDRHDRAEHRKEYKLYQRMLETKVVRNLIP